MTAILAAVAAKGVRVAALAALALAASAAPAPAAQSAATATVLAGETMSGDPIPCATGEHLIRVCHGDAGSGEAADLRLRSFDGIPLELYVVLPPATAGAGPYPLIVQSHGYGNHGGGPDDTQYFGPTAQAWARAGYAVLQLTARGFGDSCGSPASRLVDPEACRLGYVRLDDDRYEIRDIQTAIGELVDERIADPERIGLTGESYGAAAALQLATLNGRVMAPDGSLAPWSSPAGTPLHIAAAAPVLGYSDFVTAVMPNGRPLNGALSPPDAAFEPIGVEKQSFATGLYELGRVAGFYAPVDSTGPEARLTAGLRALDYGEPYGTLVRRTLSELTAHHSAYELLASTAAPAQAPAPLLLVNGFTDDLIPVDEALRYINLEHRRYPRARVDLFAADVGHARAQNKPADLRRLNEALEAFFAHYLTGARRQPPPVTVVTETCPATAPSSAFTARSLAALERGPRSFSAPAPQRISSTAGSTAIATLLDPVRGGGACATAPAADQGAGVASFRLPPAGGGGFTLIGAPAIRMRLSVAGRDAELAGRLWDVDPRTGRETLVARGVLRIGRSPRGTATSFELHPAAWRFAPGHIPKLELLGRDAPYVRASNGRFTITERDLRLTLP